MKAKILVVDHEQETLKLVTLHLQEAGYRVLGARDGKEALEKIRKTQPELIILDLNLPQMDGLELCKILRQQVITETVPVVILTARNSEVDRVLAFEFGANDYITKPFNPREVILRVGKQLHHPGPANGDEEDDVIKMGDVLVDRGRHMVKVRDRSVDLTPIEFKLLTLLAERRGRVQSRERLLQDACGYEKESCSRTVDTHMRRLRKKLGTAAKYVQTVRGFGYRLAER